MFLVLLTLMYTLKKSLGQHFLKDQSVSLRIVEAIRAQSFQQLLEVGPGAGAITTYLKDLPGVDFKAVELDHEKILWLERTSPDLKGRLIEGSILDMAVPFHGKFMLVGNFPYNISSQILFRVLDWKAQVYGMVGMFQKEVAQRVVAGPGSKDYGILSVLIQAYFHTSYLFDVEPEAFNPPPKVMSGVIRLTEAGNPYGIEDDRKFRILVKAAFNQRRKQLRNPLKAYFSKVVLDQPIFSKRAEQLSVQDFVHLIPQMS
jgi:16S rRNA (adenine1518-N6/adenine1519-N6)-dimethyltransferase